MGNTFGNTETVQETETRKFSKLDYLIESSDVGTKQQMLISLMPDISGN